LSHPHDFQIMAERKSSGSKSQPPNIYPRGTPNPPKKDSKSGPGTGTTPKSSPDAAIPPDKLNAENDK
jgi:hypothetical protein